MAELLPDRYIFVSPHLDDAILSCYPMIRSCQDEGFQVEIWTVMAGLPHTESRFSDCAMMISRNDPAGYVQIRQREDLKAASKLAIPTIHFPFPDAVYRSDQGGRCLYPDLQSLFHNVDLRELCLINQISLAIEQHLRPGDTLVVPSAVCGHVDHIMTRISCAMLPHETLYYDEFPYAIRSGKAHHIESQTAWADSIRQYESQLSFLFPGNTLQQLLAIHHPSLVALPEIKPLIPRMVHFIWVGDAPLPPAAQQNLRKWTELLGSKWQVRLWTNADLTEETFDSDVLNKLDQAPHAIQKADILRYQIMARYGGWYLELDFQPFQSIEPIALLLHQEQLILCHEEDHSEDKLSNRFFACSVGHPVMARLAKGVLTRPLNTQSFSMAQIVTQTGPVFFKAMLADAKSVLLPRKLFYPIAFSELWSDPSVNQKSSFACHVWNRRYRDHKELYRSSPEAKRLEAVRDHQEISPVMLFCFVRDEPYLLSRWIPYHASLFGIENIMVIDHGSGEATQSLLQGYEEQGMKRYDAGSYPFSEKAQILTIIMRRYKHYRFLLPLDSDEFVCLKTEHGMSCDRSRMLDALCALPREPWLFKLGTFDVCNHVNRSYSDPLVEMTEFQFFPPESTCVFSTQSPSKTLFPGAYFISTDDGNHVGCVSSGLGEYRTRLSLAHFSIRGYQHFLAKHAGVNQLMGLSEETVKSYIKEKRTNYHWIARSLAIREGDAKAYFDAVICSLKGSEYPALSEVLKALPVVEHGFGSVPDAIARH